MANNGVANCLQRDALEEGDGSAREQSTRRKWRTSPVLAGGRRGARTLSTSRHLLYHSSTCTPATSRSVAWMGLTPWVGECTRWGCKVREEAQLPPPVGHCQRERPALRHHQLRTCSSLIASHPRSHTPFAGPSQTTTLQIKQEPALTHHQHHHHQAAAWQWSLERLTLLPQRQRRRWRRRRHHCQT